MLKRSGETGGQSMRTRNRMASNRSLPSHRLNMKTPLERMWDREDCRGNRTGAGPAGSGPAWFSEWVEERKSATGKRGVGRPGVLDASSVRQHPRPRRAVGVGNAWGDVRHRHFWWHATEAVSKPCGQRRQSRYGRMRDPVRHGARTAACGSGRRRTKLTCPPTCPWRWAPERGRPPGCGWRRCTCAAGARARPAQSRP